MQLKKYEIDRFLTEPPAAVKAALIYGPDSGLVRERALTLLKTIVGDVDDPFRVAQVSPANLKDAPSLLADEFAALSFTGGRRVVWLRAAGNAETDAVSPLLDSDAPGDGFLLVQAGALSRRDRLTKLFEGSDAAVAIPCYPDEGADLAEFASQALQERGLRIRPDALAYLADRLGENRQNNRNELEKLTLYMGKDGGEIALEDVVACVGDAAPSALDDVTFAATGGDQRGLDRALWKCFETGTNEVVVLRAIGRHLQRLHLSASKIARGMSADQAMKALRPPVFYKQTAAFRGQLQHWSPNRLGQAIAIVTQAELDCKSTGMPARLICSRALMRIAQAARTRN